MTGGTMRAALLRDFGQLTVEEVPTPQPVWFSATTRSPTARPLRSVPGPSAATSPDHSCPMMNGSSGGQVPR